MNNNAALIQSMPSTTQLRQPAGRPIGGQFAENARDEATVTLEKRPVREMELGNTPEELLESAIQLARLNGSRVGLSRQDIEDVAQETLLSVLTSTQNKGEPVSGNFLRRASAALVSRRVDTHKRHEDSRAFAMWKADVEKLQDAEGRHLTRKELDEIAQNIREDWHDKRHRPSEGFQHEVRTLSLDVRIGEQDTSLAETIPEVIQEIPSGSESVHHMAELVEDGVLARNEAQRRAWNILSDDMGVPPAAAGTLSPSQARNARESVKDAVAAAQGFLGKTLSPKETNALFAPFGPGLSSREQHAIASAIASRSEMGDKLWKGALDYSNTNFAAN